MRKFIKLENNGYQILRKFFNKDRIKILHTSIKKRSGRRFDGSLSEFKKKEDF